MKKIYVCSSGQWSDFHYTKAFANEEDAKKYQAFCESIRSDDCENGYEELDVVDSYEEVTFKESEAINFDFNLETNEIVRYHQTSFSSRRYFVWSDDKLTVSVKLSSKPIEHHEKIARDYYFVAKDILKHHSNKAPYHKQMILDRLTNAEQQS